jgi:hypothetical protein
MPYIESVGIRGIEEQILQWESVMHDHNIDGFNGLGAKTKLLAVKRAVDKALVDAPTYYGEDDDT